MLFASAAKKSIHYLDGVLFALLKYLCEILELLWCAWTHSTYLCFNIHLLNEQTWLHISNATISLYGICGSNVYNMHTLLCVLMQLNWLHISYFIISFHVICSSNLHNVHTLCALLQLNLQWLWPEVFKKIYLKKWKCYL